MWWEAREWKAGWLGQVGWACQLSIGKACFPGGLVHVWILNPIPEGNSVGCDVTGTAWDRMVLQKLIYRVLSGRLHSHEEPQGDSLRRE